MLALDATLEQEARERDLENLRRAIATRGCIGQAQGILMERERITAEQAFDLLRKASQRMNVRLAAIAESVVRTGEAPPLHPS